MHNGWRNWQTWRVHMHLTNDEAICKIARKMKDANELREMMICTIYETSYEHRRATTTANSWFMRDIAIFAIKDVDWQSIYDSLHNEGG